MKEKELFPCPFDEEEQCSFDEPCSECDVFNDYQNKQREYQESLINYEN